MLVMSWGEWFRAKGENFNNNHKQEKICISDGISNILKNLLNHHFLATDKKLNGLPNEAGLN